MSKISLIHLAKWLLFATLASATGLAISYAFKYVITTLVSLPSSSTIFVYPILGAIFVGAVIYRMSPESAGEGIPAYLKMVNIRAGKVSIFSSIAKFIAAAITLSFGGSGGVVGPLVRINAGIINGMAHLFKRIHFDDHDTRTLTICGASSVLAVIFNAPVGAGFFAVEILKRCKMGYLDLFPSIITSCLTISVMTTFGLKPLYIFQGPNGPFMAENIPIIISVAIFSGLYALGYTKFYGWIRGLLGRDKLRIRYMVAALLSVTTLAYFVDINLLGTSLKYFEYLTSGKGEWPFAQYFPGSSIAILFLALAFLKALTNCITVSSGLSAGFTGPVILVGLFIGAATAQIVGVSAADTTYYAFLVAGVSGMLSASMNVPIAAAIMGAEIFGISYALPATLSSIIAFQIARSSTLYDFQFEEFDNEENVIRFPEQHKPDDQSKRAA